MRQSVIVTRLADRHHELHGRDFAETHEIIVQAGPLCDVLMEVTGKVEDLLPTGRYTISISEPYD